MNTINMILPALGICAVPLLVTAAWRVPRAIAFTMLAAVALPHLSLVRIRVQSLLVSAWLTMDSDDELQLLLVASLYLVHKRKKRRRKKCLGSANFQKNGGSMENITNFSKKCDSVILNLTSCISECL